MSKPALVLNASSGAGLIAVKGHATYSASKAFVQRFSEGLSREVLGTDVTVQALMILSVSSQGNKMKPDITTLSSPQYAKQALDHVGRQMVHYTALTHVFQLLLITTLPQSMIDKIFEDYRERNEKLKNP